MLAGRVWHGKKYSINVSTYVTLLIDVVYSMLIELRECDTQ